jgi:hypothetical protein
LPPREILIEEPFTKSGVHVAKKTEKNVRRLYTKTEERELKAHSKARTPLAKIAKLTKRTVGALRAKAVNMGIGLGHQR